MAKEMKTIVILSNIFLFVIVLNYFIYIGVIIAMTVSMCRHKDRTNLITEIKEIKNEKKLESKFENIFSEIDLRSPITIWILALVATKDILLPFILIHGVE